jgi:hypothetical protein
MINCFSVTTATVWRKNEREVADPGKVRVAKRRKAEPGEVEAE